MWINHFRSLAGLFACAILSCVPASPANAQGGAPIQIIVPYTAGGSTDVYARLIGEALGRKFDRPAVVINKPGAGGEIGSLYVARSKPDGSTLLLQAPAVTILQALRKNPTLDVRRDLAPITQAVEGNVGFYINPEVPARTIKELIAYAKANPGKLKYASFGVGSSAHLHMELFKSMAGVEIDHIPYTGGSAATLAVVKNEAQIVLADSQGSARPFVEDGKLRMLAVGSARRSTAYPDVPTVDESGLPGYRTSHWLGFFAPAGTPAEIIRGLNAAIIEYLKTPEMQQRFSQEGYRVVGSSPEDFKAFIDAEIKKWETIVADAHIEKQ